MSLVHLFLTIFISVSMTGTTQPMIQAFGFCLGTSFARGQPVSITPGICARSWVWFLELQVLWALSKVWKEELPQLLNQQWQWWKKATVSFSRQSAWSWLQRKKGMLKLPSERPTKEKSFNLHNFFPPFFIHTPNLWIFWELFYLCQFRYITIFRRKNKKTFSPSFIS